MNECDIFCDNINKIQWLLAKVPVGARAGGGGSRHGGGDA